MAPDTAYFLGRVKEDKPKAPNGVDNIPILEPCESTIKRGVLLNADANGNIGGGLTGPGTGLYRCPTGYEARIHRFCSNANGATPTAPLTTGEIVFYRGGADLANLAFFLPVSGVVAPVIWTEGKTQAVLLVSGEMLVCYGTGFTAGLAIGIGLQISLTLVKTPPIPLGIDVGAHHHVPDPWDKAPENPAVTLAPEPVE